MFQRVCMRMLVRFAAAVALAAAGCGRATHRDTPPVPPELKLEGIAFRIYRAGTLTAFGVAETASLRRDSSELRAQNVEATLPRGAIPVHLTAPAGEGSLATNVFRATGGVVVTRGTDSARTERARYEPDAGSEDGLVRGDDPVVVTGTGYRLTGTGFVLDPAEGQIVVGGGARLVTGVREGR